MPTLSLPRIAFLSSLLMTSSFAKDWESPAYTSLYQYPLPVPPTKIPKRTITNPDTGAPIDFYEVDILPLEQQVYPKLGKAKLWGYDGISPGPTFRMEKGRESVVRFINHGRLANSVHLHGSYSRSPWDGWAEDITPVGSYKDYYYPNRQAGRTLWYHDHAIDHTAENAYFGQAGFYILHDPDDDKYGLPSGNYDIPLALSAKQYNKDGTLYSPANEETSLYGDVIHVNGQPWPYMKVEPRKYRFRFLNAAISRTFNMYIEKSTATGKKLGFSVVGSDAGLLTNPVATTDLPISMAERWEIVIDFAAYSGQNITLRNSRDVGADTDYLHTDKVMQFNVGTTVSDSANNGALPTRLRDVPYPKDKTGVDHHFKFHRSNGQWQINGVTFADPNNRVLAKPQRGTTEIWELENSSGGWTHPIHIHLIDMKIMKRTGGKGRGVLPFEAAGLKDVVWLAEGETVTVEAVYGPHDGLYMFHCHNLIHEDHEMMAAFNVTMLTDLGYNETHFIDPMEERWRAKPYDAAYWTNDRVDDSVKSMAILHPYDRIPEAEAAVAGYWATKIQARAEATSVPSTLYTAVAAPTDISIK
ncbi:Cupredoxin [Pseudovirgaria hyperparasitica]|uniref:Cupredoxin n=1 Tax=Pseudovirgaria hyperparasitica TaxID=470096 RepID=A0A6A6WJ38_9PEZI|nr:Cupredoxin [Pseudovirgaria hyperparasitica]KAF2761281.1 Cupredoxin [Pseudovirgaria hyperparasitica]